MQTCTHCNAEAALGTQVASACTSCGELALAGMSMSPAALVALAAIAALPFVAARIMRALRRPTAPCPC